ncbi:unnamed protein product [Mytilus coruscus]|uniref:Carbohydrate sulfotransferase n=1 Tax=Mytilus coruscus TaxID=42192 RepID=A0A6J8ACE9_MYTCO|nr:unnamed protein product [Mytilus coruscus]
MSDDDIRKIKSNIFTSPIVLPKFNLIFFWSSKSGGTYWKRLFQFLQGIKKNNAHDPRRSGLIPLLAYYDAKDIKGMMLNSSLTKAVFVREPRERILSSYLDKGTDKYFMRVMCRYIPKSFEDFLKIIRICKNPHFEPQVQISNHLYKNMMLGKMSNIFEFTEKVMRKIGAWDNSVKLWFNSKSIDQTTRPHATNATNKLLYFYKNKDLQDQIFQIYSDDYEVFNFEKKYF